VRAVCNKREIVYRLDGKKINWLLDEVNKYEGINLSASNFYNLLNNKSNWLLTYAYIIARILECPIEDIFLLDK